MSVIVWIQIDISIEDRVNRASSIVVRLVFVLSAVRFLNESRALC